MTRSKIVPAIVAAFCGLALQFQPSGANTQPAQRFQDGTNVTYVTAQYFVSQSYPLCSPYWGTCLIIDANGFLFLIDWQGGILWQPDPIGGSVSPYTAHPTPGALLDFQTDGNAVLYAQDSYGDQLHCWRTGTTDWNGDPGVYMAVGDNGNL
jgi:hypothetical protein